MSRRCRIVVYSILAGIGMLAAALLVKLIIFRGLFVPRGGGDGRVAGYSTWMEPEDLPGATW